MKSFALTLVLCLLLLRNTTKAISGGGFVVGHVGTDHEEIFSAVEGVSVGSRYCTSNHFKTYTTKDQRVICQVECENTSGSKDASAALVSGGPGYTYVTIAYTVPRSGNLAFKVKIYG